jgi:hypothetical protein
VLLAFVLTNTAGLPAASSIDRAYWEVTPVGGSPIVWTGGSGDAEKNGLSVGRTDVLMVALPTPVPDGEADQAARFSLSALTSDWSLPEHQHHILLVATDIDEKSGLPVRCDFTRVVAAVARASSAVGVYWGAGPATHEPGFFIETTRDNQLPLLVWTGLSVARDEDRVSLLSVGMQQFGMDDLLLTAPADQASSALDMFIDLLQYALQRGRTVRAGETVGRSNDERFAVTSEVSPMDPDARVWRVDWPGPG